MSLKRLLFLAAIAAAFAGLLRACVVEGIYVASASMEPTLPVGSFLFLDKATPLLRGPRRGDLIVFRAPVPPHEEMIKRVIAVPGDRVEMRDKKVFVNGRELSEPYVRHSREGERLRGDTMPELLVPERHYFVLGDNRDESNDSTVWRDAETGEPQPFVPRDSVRGLARGIY